MILLVLSALSMTLCAGICYRLWRLNDHGDQSGAHFENERPTIRPRARVGYPHDDDSDVNVTAVYRRASRTIFVNRVVAHRFLTGLFTHRTDA
jgi:hypothetical protein